MDRSQPISLLAWTRQQCSIQNRTNELACTFKHQLCSIITLHETLFIGPQDIWSMCVISRIPSKFQARWMWLKTKLIPTCHNNVDARKVRYLLILHRAGRTTGAATVGQQNVSATCSDLSYPHGMATAEILLQKKTTTYEHLPSHHKYLTKQNPVGQAKKLFTAVRTHWTKDYYNTCWVKREHQ
jgi:hypothetical protein